MTIRKGRARTRRARRQGIALLLGAGVLVNYFDRVNLSVSHVALITAFGISNVTFGFLSAAYNWTYALCQLPVGVLLDRWGVRRVGRASTFLWSLASFGAAASSGLTSLFAARLLLGIGEAPSFPANAKAIGLWFPPAERSFATALFDAAAKLASAIGVPLIGILLVRVGWRWSFAATGFISLLYFLLFWKVYRDPQDDPRLTQQEADHLRNNLPVASGGSARPSSLRYLLKQPKVLGLALGFGSYNYVFYLLLTWLPSYFETALHIDMLHSFLYTGVPWLFATFTDLIIGGWMVDHLIQRGWNANRLRLAVLVIGTAFGLGILGTVHTHTALPALVWISISIGGLSAASPVGWSIPSLIVSRDSVGRVGGIMNFSNQISGIAAPIVTGYIVARTQSFAWAFAVASIYLVVGILGYLFLLGSPEAISPEFAR